MALLAVFRSADRRWRLEVHSTGAPYRVWDGGALVAELGSPAAVDGWLRAAGLPGGLGELVED